MRFRPLTAVLPLAAVLAGCSGDLSVLDPAGPSSQAIAGLWWAMLAGAVGLFTLIMVLLYIVFFAPRLVENVTPKQWIGWGGLAMPIPVLLALLAYAFVQGEKLFGAEALEPAVTVTATSRMWGWDFVYEQDGNQINSQDVLHIPVGQPVRILTTSTDVIHSFWVPRLGGKIDAIPGQTTSIVLRADVEGTFGGICAEYCGEGHSAMNFRVQAHSIENFQNTLRTLQP